MKISLLPDTVKPTFCWDRNWTVADIKSRLHNAAEFEYLRLAAWIMREAKFEEIWTFFSPPEVYRILDRLLPLLGRKKDYWRYTFDVWHRLGKV